MCIIHILRENIFLAHAVLYSKVGSVPPLHTACQLSGEQVPGLVQCLLDNGADPNLPEFHSLREHRNYTTVIHQIVYLGSSTDHPIAGLMQGLTSYTPLHIVCSRTDPAAAKVRHFI